MTYVALANAKRLALGEEERNKIFAIGIFVCLFEAVVLAWLARRLSANQLRELWGIARFARAGLSVFVYAVVARIHMARPSRRPSGRGEDHDSLWSTGLVAVIFGRAIEATVFGAIALSIVK